MSSEDAFAVLTGWKAFRSSLWHVKSPRAFGGNEPVFVADVSEHRHSLVLEFSGVSESIDLAGAEFEEIPPEDTPFEDRDRYVRFLGVSFPDGVRWLFGEIKPQFSGEEIM